MANPGTHTFEEIRSQPLAWTQALDVVRSRKDEIKDLWKKHHSAQVLFTGCGSTYYLALAAASLFQELTGRAARSAPAGELILYPNTVFETDIPTVLIAISRSGTTTETVAAVQQFKNTGRGPTLVITNYPETQLTELGDLTFAIPAGSEQSVAQTRSFASMYVAATAFATITGNRFDLLENMSSLPGIGEKLIQEYDTLAHQIGENLTLDRFYFLGSGSRYGLACEANLKMKEMSLTHSEPFFFFEFRHGPMSMVANTAMLIGLLSEANSSHEQAVLDEMQALGGRLLTLGETNADVAFSSGLPEAVRDVFYLPVLQLLAYYRAVAKGLNPDSPRNLSAVVHLDPDSFPNW
jgi:glucosamine--fructose-6-phosphate aminotransferase (isomerizing)